jgi:hypothetical protein
MRKRKAQNWLHQGQKHAPMMQATHLEKLILLSMSKIKIGDTVDIQKK